jgi:cystathionine beta-lyase/cystathionine gamma-synthase
VQSTLFDLGTSTEAEAIFSGSRKGYAYSRFGNPSVDTFAEVLADIEGGAGALVTSSGNAAVLCAVTAGLEGREGPLVTHHDAYGGSFELLRMLSTIHHVPVEIIDATNVEAWSDAVARAGAVLLETPSNPLMRLIDIEGTVARPRMLAAPR